MIPITEDMEACLTESALSAWSPTVLPRSGQIAAGIAWIAAELSQVGGVLYLATDYFGGTGGQDAMLWQGGQLVLSIGDDEDHISAWSDSPISRALRHIGVKARVGEDEFDALGLGRFRSNATWAKAHRRVERDTRALAGTVDK